MIVELYDFILLCYDRGVDLDILEWLDECCLLDSEGFVEVPDNWF